MFKVYVDGSYRDGYWGAGAFIIGASGDTRELSDSGVDTSGIRNVAGETQAVLMALRFLYKNAPRPENGKVQVEIYHDYEGLQKWADGEWKANKEDTQAYVTAINKAREYFDITFVKVKAHSGNQYNECADRLALNAVNMATAKADEVFSFKFSVNISKEALEDYGGVEGFLRCIKENTSVTDIKLV